MSEPGLQNAPLPPPPPDTGFGTRFLLEPELFPARLAGETWGNERVALDLPGGPYRLTGLSRAQTDRVLGTFGGEDLGPLFSRAGVRDDEIRVFRVDPREFLRFDTRGWEMGIDLEALPSESDRGAGLRFCSLEVMARLHGLLPFAGALWTPREGDGFEGVLENLLRPVVAYRLLQRGGLLLHAAGLELSEAGGALAAVGISGSGKTTLARMALSEGRTVLSDDLVAIEPVTGRGATGDWQALRIPFAGDLRQPLRAGAKRAFPLVALARLRKAAAGESAHLRLAGRAEATSWLLSCAPYVNRDAAQSARLEAVIDALLSSVPAFEMRFERDVPPWSAVTAALRSRDSHIT